MSELKPCPFCGGDSVSVTESKYGGWVAKCGWCGAEIGHPDSKSEAVVAWNRRAERTGRWVSVVNTWTQDEHEYGATWHKCDQCGRLCETKQPYCHCGAHMIRGDEHA